MLYRRCLVFAAITLSAIGRARAAAPIRASVWRDPNCGCCSGWVIHLRAKGFAVDDQVVASVTPIRLRLGTPAN